MKIGANEAKHIVFRPCCVWSDRVKSELGLGWNPGQSQLQVDIRQLGLLTWP